MEIIDTKLDCKLFSINPVTDCRGWFQVAFCADDLRRYGVDFRGVEQLNHSFTEYKGVVRGLNYQKEPFAQAKIIRCVRGALYSVAVNIDRSSSSFGKWCGFFLSAENRNLMYVPRSYAHGFVSLENNTELEYFTDNKYSFENAKSIWFDDPKIGIDWTMGNKIRLRKDILSDKNKYAPGLESL